MRQIFHLAILATLFAFGVTLTLDVDGAKMNAYTKIGEKYYMIETKEMVTWYGAAHFCRRMDAQLATIENEEEWHALSSYLVSKGFTDKQWFWLAGNNLDNGKDFYWISNGQPMSFSKWSKGQPDNSQGRENCAHLWRQGNEFQMNDWICNQKALFICEAPSPKTVSITIW